MRFKSEDALLKALTNQRHQMQAFNPFATSDVKIGSKLSRSLFDINTIDFLCQVGGDDRSSGCTGREQPRNGNNRMPTVKKLVYAMQAH